jgi:protein-tyrosine phosphatase
MTRPRGGDWLTDELDDLAMAGVSVMVSLLSDAAAAELDLIHEADAAQAAGIEFHRLPTPDRQVPDREATLALGRLLLQRLSDGASVALHCRQGIGRSSTLAAAVLFSRALLPQTLGDRVSAARGLPVPDTAEQREFINTLATK